MALQSFDDVPPTDPFYPFIEAIGPAGAKVTSGIQLSPPLYGPLGSCTHAQVRVFCMRAKFYLDPDFAIEDFQGPELFVDVPKTNPAPGWAFGHIQRAAKLGIDGGPERLDRAIGALGAAIACTRGQAAVLFLRAIRQLPVTDARLATFSDVPRTHPKWGYVERFVELGFTAGIGGGLYGVDLPMNRAAMAVFVKRVFNLPFVTMDPPEQ